MSLKVIHCQVIIQILINVDCYSNFHYIWRKMILTLSFIKFFFTEVQVNPVRFDKGKQLWSVEM